MVGLAKSADPTIFRNLKKKFIMAQIRIEEKKQTGILPWVLGLLLLGLVAWAGFAFLDDEDNDSALLDAEETAAPIAEMATEITGQPDGTYVDMDEVDVAVYREPVDLFMNYTEDMKGEMGLHHEFSHEALTYLASATEAVASAYNVDASDNVSRVKTLADEITKDPYATDHADKIRMAALMITETMENVGDRGFGDSLDDEIEALRKEAQAINSKTLTLNQKEDVRSYFAAARTILMQLK